MVCNRKGKFINTNNNTELCNIHAKQSYKNYIKDRTLKTFKIQNSKTLNFDNIKLKLIEELETRKNLLVAASAVVIENQPSFKNPRMKSIANTIYDYYLIRGVIDKHITNSNITQVKFMAPSNKLKLADEGDTKELIKVKSSDETKSYKLTKSLGIKYCTELIKHLPEWTKQFNSNKKKDDLADAFLQGVYFISNNLNNSSDTVLSFDVGVVHLAYCLLKKEYFNIDDKKVFTWSIIDWGNIDLTDRSEQKCQCGKKASLTNIIDNIQKYYCKTHSKKLDIVNVPFENYFKLIEDDNKINICEHI
jgi:hypothetical protein